MLPKRISARLFLRGPIALVAILLLAACSPETDQPPPETVATPSNTAASAESPQAQPSNTIVATDPATLDPPPSPEPSATSKEDAASPEAERATPTAQENNTEPASHPFTSPDYGVQAFLWWDPKIAKRDVALIQDLGFGWVKQSFAWRDIESLEKGKYDWWRSDKVVKRVEKAGLKMLVRLDRQPFWSQENDWPPLENAPPADLADFADFCGSVAERYQGRIAAYQVWNEPNLSREWGGETPDPAEYTELLKLCYLAIKAADPEAIVISAGLAPTGTGPPAAMPDTEFLQGMYDAGAAAYFDVLGANAPGYKAPPEAAPEEGESNPDYGGGRWFVFRHVEDLREVMVANGDEAKQVAVLEMGWTTDAVNPSYAWHAVTEQEQADYLVRAYEYAAENWSPWMGLMVTVYVADHAWTAEQNEQWWWAITLPDGTTRPAFDALRDMEK
jgi:hypothetical protein